MFSKAPRFRGSEEPRTNQEPRNKSPLVGAREARSENQEGDEVFAAEGPFLAKKNFGNEHNHDGKRPLTTDQKVAHQDTKKLNHKDFVKRATSHIPRATVTKPNQTGGGELRKPGRKSETSIKDIIEDGEIKRTDGMKINRVIGHGKGNAETDGEGRTVEASRVCQGLRGLDSSRWPKRCISKAPDLNRTAPEKVELKIEKSIEEGQTAGKSLEAQYAAKKAVFGLMVKEYKEKEKAIVDQFKVLQQIRKKILAVSDKDIPQEESIKIGYLEPPFVIDPSWRDESGVNIITYETKLFQDISVNFSDFQNGFQNIIAEYQETWVHLTFMFVSSRRELLKKTLEFNPNIDMAEFEEEEKKLESAIKNAKYNTKVKMDNFLEEVKKLYVNRETLKQELQTLMNSEKFDTLLARECKDLSVKLKNVEEELAKEKVRTEGLMEKRSILEESKLAESAKIETLEQIVSTQKNQLMQMESQYKTLKQREMTANRGLSGVKAKEIKDLKAKSELLKVLENHVTELTNDYNAQKKTYQASIEELQQSLKQKDDDLKAEIQAKQALEATLAETEEKLRIVKEKKKIFAEMVDKTKQTLENINTDSSKREEQLWKELEATKIVAKGYQDQCANLTEEKSKMLLKFQTISEDKSNKNSERLAADLVRKEEIIKNLKMQVTELQEACEEHSKKYNKLLVQIKEVHEKIDGKTDAVALSKQLGDIKMQKKELQEAVKELVSHNEELETALVQRSLELDQRDKLLKQQCNLLKIRDELTNLVTGKDDVQYEGVKKVLEQGSKWEKKAEKIYKDLEKKANEIDDMYKVLVEKQKQIDKLNKLVKTMEDQQNRAQGQRVRFELKIDELHRQLSGNKSKQTSLFN